MAVVKIAHISDLHFGAKHQLKIWPVLTTRVLRDNADLVLVTGDIVDTPNVDLYETARAQLRGLATKVSYSCAIRAGRIKQEDRGADDLAKIERILQDAEIRDPRLFVCPGNHDRHPRGNTEWAWRVANRIRHPLAGNWKFWFEKYLGSFYPPLVPRADPAKYPTLPIQKVTLGTGDNRWRVRVVALDSSYAADWFARGFLDMDEVDALSGMPRDNDVDLGILLVHHHLLSVRSLEQARQHEGTDLFNMTSLVNCGSLAEALAKNHIDIALHGHEHASNWGVYSTLEQGGGTTAILGAASGTGVVTSEPCNPTHASYNLLELYSDRRVVLWVYRWDGSAWAGQQYDLFDSQAVRRTRFLRRAEGRLKAPPMTEVVRYIEFTQQRAGVVQEYRTNWLPDEGQRKLTITARNSTGQPADPVVTVKNPEGKQWSPPSAPEQRKFKTSETEEPGTYHHECMIPPAMGEGPFRVDVSYCWLDAALLTAEELDLVPEDQKDWLRREGYEYGVVASPVLARSIQLVVRIPLELAPSSDDVGAWIQEPKREDAGEQQAAAEPVPFQRADISSCFTILAEGLYSLTVPFPLPNFEYIIAWKPPRASKMLEAKRFEAAAKKNGQNLAKAFFDALRGTELESYVPHVSLYVPDGPALRRVGHLPETDAGDKLPAEYLALGQAPPMITRAWWGGVPSRAQRDKDSRDGLRQLGFLDKETGLIALPVRIDLTGETLQPWGVVRIGLMGENPNDFKLLADEKGSELRQLLLQPMLKLLVEAGLNR
jgi:hypothetical protein